MGSLTAPKDEEYGQLSNQVRDRVSKAHSNTKDEDKNGQDNKGWMLELPVVAKFVAAAATNHIHMRLVQLRLIYMPEAYILMFQPQVLRPPMDEGWTSSPDRSGFHPSCSPLSPASLPLSSVRLHVLIQAKSLYLQAYMN